MVTTELQPTFAAAAGLQDDEELPLYYGLSLETWIKVGILGALFIAVYWLVLRWLWDKTNPIYGEANWGHAICIPIVGLYYLYINRDDLLAAPVRPNWFGLAFIVGGIVMLAYGIWPGMNQFVQGTAMIVALFGIVLLLCGWSVMKIAWFPILYLICGIPWPGLVYSYIASPLQTLAARVAVVTLRFTGVNAFRSGTKINIDSGRLNEPVRGLNVAEACAGLRSLMTFITVGAAVAFLSARPLWQKIIITLSSIPIAIFCNVMRVAGQGLLDHYVSRQLSESFAHQFVGLVMLIPAFFLILLVGWILDHIFIEEAESRVAAASSLAAARQQSQAAIGAKRPAAAPLAASRTTTAPKPAPAPAPAKPQATASPSAPAKQQPAAPASAKPQAAQPPAQPVPAPKVAAPKPAAPAVPPRPQSGTAPKPQSPATPPRPAPPGGAVPPRPGIVPPRPTGAVPPKPRPPQTPPPQQRDQKEGQ